MSLKQKILLAISLFGAATVARFNTMNSSVDLTTGSLLAITVFCGFAISLIAWSLFGIVLEISYLVQIGWYVDPLQMFIPILTCMGIGLVVSTIRFFIGKKKFNLMLPVMALLAKWLLAFGQDFWLLVFNPMSLPVWLEYHLVTELWALPKYAQAVVYTLPLWIGLVAYDWSKAIKPRNELSVCTI